MIRTKTSREINEAKWRKMRSILNKLKEKPMSASEIEYLVCRSPTDKIGKRTAQNYTAELIAIGVVVYDSKSRLYNLAERKRVFESKSDFKLALDHSKRLLLTNREDMVQLFDFMHPGSAIDEIAFREERYPDLESHLRTGYFKEVWIPLEKYRALQKKHHFKPANMGSLNAVLGGSSDAGIPEDDLERIEQLRKTLIGEIYSIMERVKNKIPLSGDCDNCPNRHIIVKDNATKGNRY